MDILTIVIMICNMILILLNLKTKRIAHIISAWLSVMTSFMVYITNMTTCILYILLFIVILELFFALVQLYVSYRVNHIAEELKNAGFNNIQDSSGYFTIKEFEDCDFGRTVDVSKCKEDGKEYRKG